MNEHPIDPFLAAWSGAAGSDGFAARPLVRRALQAPGPWTRARLHAALAAVLVQEPAQRDRFEETFALWFGTDDGGQDAEILDLNAWLRTPLAHASPADNGGEYVVAAAECLAETQQPTASTSHRRRRWRWWWAALDATVLLLLVAACLLAVVRKPSPKPGAASASLSRKAVPDAGSVVEGRSRPTEVRSQPKLTFTVTDGERAREQRDRNSGSTKPNEPVKSDQRATVGAPPDARVPAGHEGSTDRPRGGGVMAAGGEELRTAPDAPMSQAQAIQTLSKAGIVKNEHRSGIGGLRWF
jgi:hypothetical protein